MKNHSDRTESTAQTQDEDAFGSDGERRDEFADSIPGAVYQFVVNPQGGYSLPYMSRNAEAIFERPVAELRDERRLFEDVIPEDLPGLRESIAEAIAGVREWFHQFRILTGQGRIKWIQAKADPHVRADGSMLWSGIILDMTRHKQTEVLLRESRERLAALSDASFEAVFLSDEGICLNQNAAARRMFGYTDAEAVGRHASEWIAPEDRDQVRENMRIGFEKPHRVTAQRKDGTTFPAEIQGRMTTFQGRSIRVTALRDISDRTLAEKEAEESRLRYQSLYGMLRLLCDNVPDLIWAKDLNKNYLFANKALCRRLLNAADTDEPIGKSDPYFALRERKRHPENPNWHTFGEICQDSDAIVMETRQPDRFDEYGHAIGKFFYLDVHKAPFYDENGKFIGTVGCGRDVTREKQMEGQLRMAQKMEAIGTLAGGIAHDFNNILSIIIGNTELAMDDVLSDNAVRRNLEEIMAASMRARQIVRQILSYTRKTEQDRLPVNVRTLVREAIRLLRATIPQRIRIVENIPEDEVIILIDPAQINQIVLNLGTNAVHAMPDGGTLTFGLEQIDADALPPERFAGLPSGRYARFSVQDTGHGIPEQCLSRIFDPYFTTKEVGKGTGMGLSIVHGIVTGNDGRICVESRPGEGARFEILFPVVNMEHYLQEEPETKRPAGSGRILLVDDEAAIVSFQSERLARLGYHMRGETDPARALEILKADPLAFDLVITDMSMPGMDGDGLIREIRALRADMPVILCTGYSELVDEERARHMNVSAFMEKPLNTQRLAETIRTLLKQGKDAG